MLSECGNPSNVVEHQHRRGFLSRCGGCALAACCVGGSFFSIGGRRGEARAAQDAPRREGKPRVRLVFSHRPFGEATWPHQGFDYESRKRELLTTLTDCNPSIDWRPVTVTDKAEAEAVVAGDSDVDGYLVYCVGIWTGGPEVVLAADKPTLLIDDLYAGTGEFLVQYAAALRAGRNVAGVASSLFEDVSRAVNMLTELGDPAQAATFGARCRALIRSHFAAPGDVTAAKADAPPTVDAKAALEAIRGRTILMVGGTTMGGVLAPSIVETFGTPVEEIGYHELDAEYRKVDLDLARELAYSWVRQAGGVVEPTMTSLVPSAAMSIGMKVLMEKRGASAIGIDCLGGFYGGELTAYPCLGFTALNDAGLVGACEADLRSALTMLVFGALVDRPGYISDPVIDTSKNQVIYAHCVAPTKVDGPSGPTNPFVLRNHAEDRRGASMQSLLPLGRLTTTIELDPKGKRILFHQAKAVANVVEDKACRTKLACEVKGDIEKLFTEWDHWGWHRVTFYGDLAEPVNALADALGYSVVAEA